METDSLAGRAPAPGATLEDRGRGPGRDARPGVPHPDVLGVAAGVHVHADERAAGVVGGVLQQDVDHLGVSSVHPRTRCPVGTQRTA